MGMLLLLLPKLSLSLLFFVLYMACLQQQTATPEV